MSALPVAALQLPVTRFQREAHALPRGSTDFMEPLPRLTPKGSPVETFTR